jgi:hypothetical protein
MDTSREGRAGCLDLPTATATDDQRAPVGARSGTVVLVVDDDPEIRDVVRWLLEDEPWSRRRGRVRT